MSKKPTVLVITYYFPPSGGAGVQRVLKTVKYLPELGWKPIVLTVTETADFPARDPSLLSEIPPEVEVHRTPIFEPYQWYRKWTGRAPNTPIDIVTNTDQKGRSFSENISQWIRATFFIPDARRLWQWPAVKKGMEILRSRPVDVLFSTAPPYTCHLIARSLKQKTKLPWVADFRDSWVGWLSTPKRWFLPHWVDFRLEKSVLHQADRLISVSQGVQLDLLSRHPEVPISKWTIIPNGFDEEDFQGLQPKTSSQFILTYAGSLYGKRNPMALVQAVESLLAIYPEWSSFFRLRFIGRIDPQYLEALTRLGSIFEYIPYVPHRTCLEYLCESTGLILIIDQASANASILTGKIYEYLAVQKPILALAPEGEASRLIRALGAGTVVSPEDSSQIQSLLREWVEKWKKGKALPSVSKEKISQFDRKNLTQHMVHIFNALLKEKIHGKAN